MRKTLKRGRPSIKLTHPDTEAEFTLTEWAQILGLHRVTLYQRFKKHPTDMRYVLSPEIYREQKG